MRQEYLMFPGTANIGEVLQTYAEREANYWWLLVTEREGQYYVCSFGSLLPYLTGRRDNIEHNIGDCVICSAMDPVFWQETEALVEEALADPTICCRLVAELPMADLPVIADEVAQKHLLHMNRATLIMEGDVIQGVHVNQMR